MSRSPHSSAPFAPLPASTWILSDGTMGMMSQSFALAQSLGLDATDMRAVPTPWLRLFPSHAAIPGWQLTFGRKPDWLKAGIFPELLITCGTRMAGLSVGIRRLTSKRTKTIHIQDPRISPHHFDMLIVAAHDKMAALAGSVGYEHVLVSTGSLNRLTHDAIAEQASSLSEPFSRLHAPVYAVMIGGHNKRYKAGAEAFAALGRQLAALANKTGASLALIPSRRTPARHLKNLTIALTGLPYTLWDGQDPNPYPGILGQADAVIVTSDSVSMTSEVALTGKPLMVATLREEEGRIAEFHTRMRANHHTVLLEEVLENPDLLTTPFAVLDEMPALSAQVRQHFGWQDRA